MGNGVVAELGYTGSLGRHLLDVLDVNQIPANSLGTAASRSALIVTRPFYSTFPNYATINQVIEKGWVNDPSDLYRLTKDQVKELEGFADKSAQNLVDRIAESRRAPLSRSTNSATKPLKRGSPCRFSWVSPNLHFCSEAR